MACDVEPNRNELREKVTPMKKFITKPRKWIVRNTDRLVLYATVLFWVVLERINSRLKSGMKKRPNLRQMRIWSMIFIVCCTLNLKAELDTKDACVGDDVLLPWNVSNFETSQGIAIVRLTDDALTDRSFEKIIERPPNISEFTFTHPNASLSQGHVLIRKANLQDAGVYKLLVFPSDGESVSLILRIVHGARNRCRPSLKMTKRQSFISKLKELTSSFFTMGTPETSPLPDDSTTGRHNRSHEQDTINRNDPILEPGIIILILLILVTCCLFLGVWLAHKYWVQQTSNEQGSDLGESQNFI